MAVAAAAGYLPVASGATVVAQEAPQVHCMGVNACKGSKCL